MAAKAKLDIIIHALGLPFDGNTIKTKSLGGSESAAYYQARELARRGHRVQVWTSQPGSSKIDGVIYSHVGEVTEATPLGDQFTFYASRTPHDVLIIQRHPLAFHKDWASKVNIWQLHDVAIHRTAAFAHGGLSRIDFITGVSQWHIEQLHEIWGINPEHMRIVPNGVDAALYDAPYVAHPTIEGLRSENKFIMLYQSRPERGLEHLLRPGGIMQRLAEAGSRAQLVLCGYDNSPAHMSAYYAQLEEWAKVLPNVTHLGHLNKADLAQLQRGCDVLCYPTEFAEVSCITVMEAMHAGLPIITSRYAALAETCAGTGTVFVNLKGDQKSPALDNLIAGNATSAADEDGFVNEVKRLERNKEAVNQLKVRQLKNASRYTWAKAVDQLEAVIEEAFERRYTPTRALRHLIEHSDIVMAKRLIAQEAGNEHDAIYQQAVQEVEEMYAFTENQDALKQHYSYWEGLNCAKLEAVGLGNLAVEIENFTRTTRFRGILQFVAQGIREAKARLQLEYMEQKALYDAQQASIAMAEDAGNLDIDFGPELAEPDEPRRVRVLEFGCAHGHVILPLTQMFPDVDFVGVDFMAKSIGLAFKGAQEFQLGNVELSVRDQNNLDDLGQFDVILAAEVLEHVVSYAHTYRQLAKRLTPDGAIVTTTPCGRWEWSGRDNWRLGREHLHHFERQDLLDIFGPALNPDGNLLYAPVEGHDGVGGQMGSWLCYTTPRVGDEILPLSDIDFERKLRYLAPRETVSLCMIVKDAENTLRKALQHVCPWVDEVIIGLDKTTTDKTEDVAARVENEYPQVNFTILDIDSPLEIGFAAARNKTIDKAAGDWIMWMDADEEVPAASNIWRRLRPSPINAYACSQVHYAMNPAQVLATDYPGRIFRNNRGVQFHGLVHEHPEDDQGKAIAHTQMCPDIQFLHSGYVDENTRRARYQRNLPLLLRDVQENPKRTLNRFLLLRDLAQGIGFENSMTGGVNPDMQERAKKGIDLFVGLLSAPEPQLRMIADALPYYSICVEVLGINGAFDADVSVGTQRVGTQTMAGNTVTKGRFHDRKTFFDFLNLIAQESTKCYESKYA